MIGVRVSTPIRWDKASQTEVRNAFTLAILGTDEGQGGASAREVVGDVARFVFEETRKATPVDTGFMRDHLEARFSDDLMSAEVGWYEDTFLAEQIVPRAGLPRFYAPYVVFGTFKMPARNPFPPEPAIIAEFGGGTVGG